MLKIKNTASIASLVGAAIALITLIAFSIYGVVYDYFDTGVFGVLVLSIVCGCIYAFIDKKWTAMFSLIAIFLDGIGLGVFFLNSFYVWADRINNIEMYGSRGTLVPVVAIMILFILSVIAYIVSCFARKEAA